MREQMPVRPGGEFKDDNLPGAEEDKGDQTSFQKEAESPSYDVNQRPSSNPDPRRARQPSNEERPDVDRAPPG